MYYVLKKNVETQLLVLELDCTGKILHSKKTTIM